MATTITPGTTVSKTWTGAWTTTQTTGNISVTAGQLIVAVLSGNASSGSVDPVGALADNQSNTWQLLIRSNAHQGGSGVSGTVEIWCTTASATTSTYTVSAHATANSGSGGALHVTPMTGASTTQSGATATNTTASTGNYGGATSAKQLAITAGAASSLIVVGLFNWTANGAWTYLSNTSQLGTFADSTNGDTYSSAASNVDAGTGAHTFGATNNVQGAVIAVEIQAASGPTTITGSETYTEAEASAVSAAAATTDTAGLTEVSAQAAAAATTDTASTADVSALVAALSRVDAGTLAEVSAVSGVFSRTDAGALADASTIAATTATTDVSTLSESSAAVVSTGSTDSASLLDSSNVNTGGSTYNGYGATDPGLTFGADALDVALGWEFRTTNAGVSDVGARIFIPTGATGTLTGATAALYNDNGAHLPTGAPLSSATFGTLVPGAWNEVTLTSVALTQNTDYVLVIWLPGNVYGFIGSYYAGGSVTTPNAPDIVANTSSFQYGPVGTLPNGTSQAWFGTDVTLSAGAVTTPITGTESPALGEADSIVATVSTTEAAGLGEADQVAASLASADTVAMAEASVVFAAVFLTSTDSGTLAETRAISAATATIDAGSVGEGPDSVSLASTDASTLSESSAVLAGVFISSTDTGTVAEARSITAAATTTDTGTSSEGTGTIALASTDTGSLSEASAIFAGVQLNSTDSFTFDDTPTNILVSDGADATLTETSALNAALASADTGSLTESSSVTTTGASPSSSDTGALGESSLIVVTLATLDSMALAEARAILGNLTTTDTGALGDGHSIFTGSNLASVDPLHFAELSAVMVIPFSGDITIHAGPTVTRYASGPTAVGYASGPNVKAYTSGSTAT